MKARVSVASIVAMLLTAAGVAAAAGFQSPNREASVTFSSVKAGASNVGVVVQVPTVLECGRPTGGGVVLTLPRNERMPRAIAAASVRVNGLTASKVTVAGRVVTVSLPIHRGVTCFALIDGMMKIAVAPAAALGNPPSAGSYAVGIRQGKTAYVVPVAIKA
jgi:hypothetical protein